MSLTQTAIPATGTLRVEPWPDAVIDALGHDPRSTYVETFWLGTLGPSTTWLLRRVAYGLEASPTGFDLDLSVCARELGLGDKGGRHSVFARSLGRLAQFDVARWSPSEALLQVRRWLPPLTRHQVARLPTALQARHNEWQAQQLATPPAAAVRQRCRALAQALLVTGSDRAATERQLTAWEFHPALSYEAANWAAERVAARGHMK